MSDPLSSDVANLARRIHFSRVPVLGVAEVLVRLRQRGYEVTAEQVREVILHPPRRWRFITWT